MRVVIRDLVIGSRHRPRLHTLVDALRVALSTLDA